jgi:uncharacterized membrane protein HdeD (DUF308 family)
MATTLLFSGLSELRQKWGWLLALGIVMILLGFVALSIIPYTTIGTSIVLGWLLVVSGIFEVIEGFQLRRSSNMFLHLIGGVLGIFVGLLIVTHPVAGALVFTMLFASFLTVSGVFHIVTAARLKFPRWGWAVFNGVVTLALGLMVWAGWPFSAAWFLGLAVGISLILRGWSYVMLAIAVHSIPAVAEVPNLRRAA